MAKNINNRTPFAFTPVVLDQESHEKRRVIKQLPGVHQTETLQKFFGSTVDHLFDPGKSKPINGYAGQKPLWYDPDQDYYLEENTSDRTFYQLEASMVSKSTEGSLTDLLPYADLVNQIRFQGGLVNNHNRLFSQDFYTWCPPIDLDKILNFRQYVWLPIDDVEPTSTFEDGSANGWLLSDGTPAPVSGPYAGLNKYLGGFAGTPTGEQIVSKTFVLNSNVTTTGIQFDFLKLNSWDSKPIGNVAPQLNGPERIFVYLNDQVAFEFTPVDIEGRGGSSIGSGTIDLGDITGSYNVTSPGVDSQLDADHVLPGDDFPNGPATWTDRVYRINITLNGTGGNIKMGFGSNTDESLGNEALGIDNVRVFQSTKVAMEINGPTVELISKGDTADFWLPGYGPGADTDLLKFYDLAVLNTDLIHVEVDGVSKTFFYTPGAQKITFLQRPAADAQVKISVYSDLENNAIGSPATDAKAFGGVQLSSGMRIIVNLDKNTDYKNTDVWIVEGVGSEIFLIKEEDWGAGAAPDYMVMARGAANRNEWSTRNRWFHVNTLPASMDADYVANHRATRPIIEFNRDLELYNYGLRRRLDVDLVVDNIEDLNAYLNQYPTDVTLSGVRVTTRGTNQINIPAVNPRTGITYGDVTSIRVMVRNTVNTLLNNNILVLVNQGGALKLILETDGENPSGEPVHGEVFNVLLGTYAGKNLNWDGINWVESQLKTKANQAPLFELYDLNGNSLRDETLYPSATFKGSKLFSYQEDLTGTRVADSVLGISLVHDNKGQILFENYLGTETYQYVVGGKFLDIVGFYFHKVGNIDSTLETLSNDWYKAPSKTRQFMIDRFTSNGRTKLFTISQEASEISVTRGRVNESKSFERTTLVEDKDFIRIGRQVMILNIQLNDIIEVRTYSDSNPPLDATGHYEVPLNLQANPDNDEIVSVTKGDFYDHFSDIMKSQAGFIGAEYSSNNYRDTAKAPNLGSHIIQHSAGLLKTMLLASSSQLDIMAAIRYVESEYARFKNKFQQKILNYSMTNKLTSLASDDVWINTALEELNKGKTKHFPFYLSGMAQNEANQLPTFIPATPSFLGVYPLFAPESITQEVNGAEDVWFVRGHDGSLTQAQNETCARILLALEQRIFDSVPANIRDRERPACDWLEAYGDQFRTNDYSYEEYLQILRPAFERWSVAYRQDYKVNDTFDAYDVWSWNWSGLGVPGHWRGIYEKFFGTQRPDLTPWESLGFAIKPVWWDGRYGAAPYTSENLVLWDDIEKGYIAEGTRKGINPTLARPGIQQFMPVDVLGRLRHPGPRNQIAFSLAPNSLRALPDREAFGSDAEFESAMQSYEYDPAATYPEWLVNNAYKMDDFVNHDNNLYKVMADHTSSEEFEDDILAGYIAAVDISLGCGICKTLPLHQERSAEWNWGDLGPVEQTWRRSSNFAFSVAGASYLMKPAAFVELGWNTEDIGLFFKGTANEQWMNQDTKGRPSHKELQVHGEILEDLSLVTKVGVQQWVSDLLASKNTAINENFATRVRGLGTQLSYKVAGFTDATTLVSVTDAFGRVPSEDVTIALYRSPSIREETYSGIAIEYTGRGYEIYGYNNLDPHFNILAPAINGRKISVGDGAASAAIPGWKPSTYYSVGLTVKYQDNFYRATKTHTSSTYFESNYWTQVARPQYADGTALVWYLEGELNPVVEQVPYGTVLKTPQDVANFMNSYQRYLESRGWIFEDLSSDEINVNDWKQALRSFITWSNADIREVGDYITLSPASQLVRFKTDQGTIQPVEQIVNGLYAIVDQNGQPIDSQATRVVRNDGDISISCDNTTSGIFGLRLYVSELEHVIVFNNQTIFGDTIYSPLLNIKQPRIRLQGFKTVNWKGRIDAPGFIVTGDTLTPNFERAADDFRRFFDIESMENKKLQDRARANFGYEEKDYLNNLLLTPTNQFEFYQGMIQQKGSSTSMRRLLRSNFIRHNKGLKLFEEWAFRVGDYGGQEVTPQLDIQIRQSEFKHNPQMIQFTNQPSTNTYGVIEVLDTNVGQDDRQLDDRWQWRPDMKAITWPLADFNQLENTLPTAGPVSLDEVRFTVATNEEFEEFFGQQEATDEPLETNDRLWVYGIGEGAPSTSWMTYKFHDTSYKIQNVFIPSFEGQGSVVQLNKGVGGYVDVNTTPWNTTFYVTQPLLSGEYDENGYALSGEKLIVKNLENSDLNPLTTYKPKFMNKATQTLSAVDGLTGYIMGFYPEAYQMIKSIKVIVEEAFDVGSTIEVGFPNDPDGLVGINSVNITQVGTYEFSREAGNTMFPWSTNLAGADRNLIANLSNSSPNGLLHVEVEYFYICGFELTEPNSGSNIPTIVNEDGGTADLFTWVKTRYANVSVRDSIPTAIWSEDDIVEIDNGPEAGHWSTFKRINGAWVEWRRQNRKINSELLNAAGVFNSKENKLKLVLQLYDPYKGYIPGIADRELDYKTMTDPAIYNDGRMVWGKEQVGQLWWDQSAVRYLDYEIYDRWNGSDHEGVNYRWKNWGRVAPNSDVNIYQWTRSPVAPNTWAEYVESKANLKIDNKPSGTVLETTNYVVATEWNDEIQTDETVYYFWVLNPTVVPTKASRKLSAQQVSNVIANPTSNDIPFFAVIDTNKVVVGGIKQFLNETDTVLKVKWLLDAEIVNNHHKQWMILREEDERNTINDQLWNKMRDSLVGWDATDKPVPDEKLPGAQQVGSAIRPRQSWFPADVSPNGGQRPSRGARAAFVDIMNDILSKSPFIDQWYNWGDVFDKGEDMPTSDRYITTALDLVDLKNLLPASRNMVQPGESVLIQNTAEAAGFWTLWKLVEVNGQRTFILDDFQKWRMQEGELWNLADWYDTGWSASNFPNYRFATTTKRDEYGNLDVTLLKGTLVQIDHTDGDGRWTWDVYTSTTKYQVAKAKATLKLSDAFYDDSRVEFGPKQIASILGTTEATRITPERIQELADVINYRDGSREIEFMLDSMKTILLDTLQKNRLFFSMVRSAFKQSNVVDWAFKTSFLYLGGYSETLRQSPVAFADQIDNVIAYLEEVKPYHVKIREYVRRLSYGPDLADLAMTDFDKPVYPDGSRNRVLDVTKQADRDIMGVNRPWKDWYENYQKTPMDLEDWNLEWNGVRKMNISMKFDRISCGTISGWDTSPWDPALLVYSQLGNEALSLSELSRMYRAANTQGNANFYKDQAVETIEDRNYLVRKNIVTPERPGTIVTVLSTGEHFMWSGTEWIKFESVGWDRDPDMGSATRIEESYRPLAGMKRKDDPGLIAGCEFDGTVMTDDFVNDEWDVFEWDYNGYDQAIRERAGVDQDGVDGNTTPEVEADPAYIATTGNEFSQPAINGARPHELVQIRGIESIVINVVKASGPYQKSFMNTRGKWEDSLLAASAMTFVSWDQSSKSLNLTVPNWAEDAQGFSPLHDPQNPSTGFIRTVMLTKGYRSSSNVDMTSGGSKTFKLRDLADVDGIPAGLTGNGVKVAVVNTKDPTKRAIGTLQNSKGSEKNWNGSIVIEFTDGFVNIGSGKSWNIMPVDMFNEPGVVWIGDARFTYNSLERSGNSVTLRQAYMSGNSLAPLAITDTSVALVKTTPVLDGSIQRRKV